MKVSSLTDPLRFVKRVEKKDDAQNHDDGQSNQKNGSNGSGDRQGASDQRQSDQEFDEYALNAAIQQFGSDEQAQAAGLHAEAQNQGPGLKVVLKDGNGAVVRQFTGEEFIKVREAAAKGNGLRGKILDQKL